MKKLIFIILFSSAGIALAMEEKTLADLKLIADANKNAACWHFAHNQMPGAIDQFKIAANLAEKAEDFDTLAYSYGQIGKMYINVFKKIDEGKEFLDKASKVKGPTSHTSAILFTAEGDYALYENDFKTAEEKYRIALPLNLEQPKGGLSLALNVLVGYLCEKRKDLDEAKQFYMEALPGTQAQSNSTEFYWASYALGRLTDMVSEKSNTLESVSKVNINPYAYQFECIKKVSPI